MAGKVILAYSGGLDTSVAIKWIHDEHDLDVVALTIDVGNDPDLEGIRKRALKIGAVPAVGIRAEFLRQARNILTKFVHGRLLIPAWVLTICGRSLSAAWTSRNRGTSNLWGTGPVRAGHAS